MIDENTPADKLLNQAQILLQQQNFDEAKIIFGYLVSKELDNPEQQLQLCDVAIHIGENIYAADRLAAFLEKDSSNAYANFLFATVMHNLQKTDEAVNFYAKAIENDTEYVNAYIALGRLEVEIGNYTSAYDLLKKAIELKPSNMSPYIGIIGALRGLHKSEEAYLYAKKLIKKSMTANNCALMARVQIELGDKTEAEKFLRKAIQLDKTCGSAYHDLAAVKKFSSEDKKDIRKFEQALEYNMPVADRSLVHFSLGKIYNDCKQYDKAFSHYEKGNQLGKPATEQTHFSNRLKRNLKTFTKKLLNDTEGLGNKSTIPVFVVGMPRSGTTLIESIIASHPDADGADELINMIYTVEKLLTEDNLSDSKLRKRITKELVEEYTEAYLDVLCQNREGAKRVVDKMPANYANLGAIQLCFPNAKIIHAIRNPIDTCLSCYFQSLANVPATFDFTWLAKEYREYREAVEHWKKILPENKIFEVRYEEMISAPEQGIRNLIKAIDLDWDPACLEFYKNKRSIGTASFVQARQPIYSSSSKRWLNYAPYLSELANGLKEYLSDEDIAILKENGVKVKKGWKLF